MHDTRKTFSSDAALGAVLVTILGLGGWALVGSRVAAEAPRTLPAPAVDEPPPEGGLRGGRARGRLLLGIQGVIRPRTTTRIS